MKASNRPQRTSLQRRRLLEAKERPGYRRRWVNEEVGAIEDYIEAGWSPVAGNADASDTRVQNESKLGSTVRRVVNRSKDASCHYAVLMEIPEELYQEQQTHKQLENDEIEASIDPRLRKQDGSDYGHFRKS